LCELIFLFLFLLDQEKCVEHDRFREGNRQNLLHQNFRGCHRIASHGNRSPHPNQAHGNGRAKRCQTYVQTSTHMISSFLRHLLRLVGEKFLHQLRPAAGSSSCWQISKVKTAVSNMNTRACTRPTSSSRK